LIPRGALAALNKAALFTSATSSAPVPVLAFAVAVRVVDAVGGFAFGAQVFGSEPARLFELGVVCDEFNGTSWAPNAYELAYSTPQVPRTFTLAGPPSHPAPSPGVASTFVPSARLRRMNPCSPQSEPHEFLMVQ